MAAQCIRAAHACNVERPAAASSGPTSAPVRRGPASNSSARTFSQSAGLRRGSALLFYARWKKLA